MGFLGADTDTREKDDSIYPIIFWMWLYVWQRYVMEAGYLTNFTPNISAAAMTLKIYKIFTAQQQKQQQQQG